MKSGGKGPCFLYKPETQAPKTETTVVSEEAIAEVVKNPVTQTQVLTTAQSKNEEPAANIQAVMDCNPYSSKMNLLGVTALVTRFVKRSTKRGTQVNAEDMKNAEILWLKSVQSSVLQARVESFEERKREESTY